MNLIAGRKAALKEEDEKTHKLEIAMLEAHELVLTQMHNGQNFHDDEMKENPAFFAAFNCMRRMKQPKNREQWEELEKNTANYPIDEFFRLAAA